MRLHALNRLSIATLAALMLTAMLTGCGENTNQAAPIGAAGAGQPTPPAAGKEDTLAKIKREGVLKWGADAEGGAPFVYRDLKDTEKIVGFEMDIMDAFCKHMGVKHERVQGQWVALPDQLTSNRSDMIVNGYEINEDRKKVVLLSNPYYAYEQQLTVRAADKDKYKTLADLKGLKIAVLEGAEAENVLKEAGFTEDLIAKYEDSQTPYQELEIKRVEAVLQESIIAAHYAGNQPALFNVPATFSPGQYTVLIRKGDETLLAETNRILEIMKKNGELAAIYKKWNIHTDQQKSIGIESK